MFLVDSMQERLTDKQLEELLNTSDIDLSDEGEEEDTDMEEILRRADEIISETQAQDVELPVDVELPERLPTDGEPVSSTTPVISEASSPTTRPLIWLNSEMPHQSTPIDEETMPVEGDNVHQVSPLFSFFEYFNLEFWESVAAQTNLYSVQTRNHKSVNTNVKEIIHLAGVIMAMGILRYPQGKLYWNNLLSVPVISDTMKKNRFFELRNLLHFVDNMAERDGNDKLWKIRPVVDAVLNKCQSLPKSTHLSIDEQMVPFSGRCEFRQFVPNKPNPVGLKNFVLAAKDGLVLDFHIYVGKNTLPQEDMKSLGLGSGIVKLLLRTVTEACHLYTDRFFTSLKLIDFLNENMPTVKLTGTVQKNRIGPVSEKLKDDKQLPRGSWDEKVRSDEKACVVKWKDSKAVLMISNAQGSSPVHLCKRWSNEKGRKVDVTMPGVVKSYNKAMGGIDLCDRMISFYRSSMRTKKWTTRVFSHFLDLVCVNCWIMYVRSCIEDSIPPKDRLGLLSYRLHIAIALMQYEGGAPVRFYHTPTAAGSRRSSRLNEDDSETEAEVESTPKRRRTVVPHAIDETRYDNVGHLPRFCNDKFASKCRLLGCSSRSRVMCTKCNVYLCVLKNNCFETYHSQ